jgi:hypothetical protein
MTFEEKIEKIVRKLIAMGWDMGKKQHKTPYDYTCDTDKGEKYWKQILKAHKEELREIIGEMQQLIQETGEVDILEEAIEIIRKRII